MNKILTILLCYISCQTIHAGQVTEAQALQKAQRFMSGKQLITSPQTRGGGQTDSQPFYVFNAKDNAGYVIVSGDDRTEEILAFSEQGSLDVENAPENLKWWLGYYERVIKSLGTKSYARRVESRAAKEDIPYLIKTTWSQTAPYNNDCPEIGTGKCLTGCLATAMAQVMNYWQYPASIEEIPAYDPIYDRLFGPSMKALPQTEFNWTALQKDDKADAEFKTEVAKLCLYCGQSVRMGYATDNLGGSRALDGIGIVGLVKHFKYDKGTRYIFRGAFSDSAWEDSIYNELKNGRPVIYSGQSEAANGAAPYGHTFICDGYKEVDNVGYFHINWGWGTDPTNAYYLLSLPQVSGYTFSEDQSAVIGIQPPKEDVAKHKMLSLTKLDLLQSPVITRASVDEIFPPIYFSWVIKNTVVERTTATLDFILTNEDKMVSHLGSTIFDILPGWNISNAESQMSSGAMKADGVYRLYPRFTMAGDPPGLVPVEGSDYRYIEIIVEGLKMTIKAYPEDILKGDANGDGVVNMKDRDLILAAIAAGKYDKQYDVNTDGKITVADIVALYDIIDNNQ